LPIDEVLNIDSEPLAPVGLLAPKSKRRPSTIPESPRGPGQSLDVREIFRVGAERRAQPIARSAGSAENAGTTSRAKRRSVSRPPALLTSTYSAPTWRNVWSFAAISSGVP
jgi:hypothetical protein